MMKKLDLNSITISLIIPTLNAAEYMPGLIDILGRQTRKPDEIIVIDSESEDATVETSLYHHLTWLQHSFSCHHDQIRFS